MLSFQTGNRSINSKTPVEVPSLKDGLAVYKQISIMKPAIRGYADPVGMETVD